MDRATFLRARDPSILTTFPRPRKCLLNEFDKTHENVEEDSSFFDVNVRVKQSDIADCYEIDVNTIRCVLPATGNATNRSHDDDIAKKLFTFNHVFSPETTQQHLFDAIVKKKVFDFINGLNTNLLTYGTSGSGKTYTLVGTDQHPGMIPQSLEYLFQTLRNIEIYPVAKYIEETKQVVWLQEREQEQEILRTNRIFEHPTIANEMAKHRKIYEQMKLRMAATTTAQLQHPDICVGFWVSCAQIYNEHVFDLLTLTDKAREKSLRVVNNKGHTYVKNLEQLYVSNGMEAYLAMQFGLCNAKYASTGINEHSSRSHTIFRITMIQCTEKPSHVFRVNHLTFSDLAGSERAKKTLNVGHRFKESNNINNSLVVLGRCITAVRAAQKDGGNVKIVAPFRESKLTQLFQNALQGMEDISMIVNITAEPHMVHETLHSLNFSAVAKEIQVDRKPLGGAQPSTDLRTQLKCAQHALEMQEARESKRLDDLRTELVDKFREILDESKRNLQQRHAQEMQDLQEEIEELRSMHADDSISSAIDCDSFEERVADLSTHTKYSRSRLLERYESQYNEFAEFRAASDLKNAELEKKCSGLQMEVNALNEQLFANKLKIIELEDNNEILNNEVVASIRCSSAFVRVMENELSDDE